MNDSPRAADSPLSTPDALELATAIRDEITALRAENTALKQAIRNAQPLVVVDYDLARSVKKQLDGPTHPRSEAERRRRTLLRAMNRHDIRKILRAEYGENYFWDTI